MPGSRRLPRRRPRLRPLLALVVALLLGLGLWAPMAAPAGAAPGPSPLPRSSGTVTHSSAPSRASGTTAQQRQRTADRRAVRAAPRGMAAFVAWLQSVGQQGATSEVTAARAEADVAALDRLAPRAARELAAMKKAKAQQLLLAVARTEMAPALERSHATFTGDVGFFFYTNLQRQLEQLGKAAGSRGQLTFLPLLPTRRTGPTLAELHREVTVDQDGDGVSDAYDPDVDGSGGPNEADVADNIWGIPDEFLVRTPFVAGPVRGTADTAEAAPSSCFLTRESVPRLMTVAAAAQLRTARGCRRLTGHRGVVPGNTATPTVSGTPTVGSTLTANPGTWSGDPAPSFTYRWQYRDSTGGWPVISGATAQTYVVQPGDSGRVIRVDVTGTNSAGSAEVGSDPVGPVTGDTTAPENLSRPTIAGTPQVGVQLVASPGSWTGSPTAYGYTWQRSAGGTWAAVPGATAAAYTPSSDDVGYQLRVSVTASNAGGQNAATSTASAAVPAAGQAPVNTALPAVVGNPVVGTALAATPGTWTGTPAPGFGYAWQRSTTPDVWTAIAGATGASYTPVNGDLGQSLRVLVTATNASGSAAVGSAEVGPVVAPGGCPVGTSVDTDHDGITDCREIAGFTLVVATTGTGATTARKVFSDPTLPDTDADGIKDGLEWQASISDPSSADTDIDGLTDYQELIVYKSLPANVDSDGDALVPNTNPPTPDPRLEDGTEVHGYPFAGATISTSPTLADTDGDSIGDYTEINSGGYNPLVADMPKLQVGIPDGVETDIQIITKRSSSDETTTYQGTTTTSTDSTKTHAVDLTNTKTLNTNTSTLDIGAKGGVQKGKPFGEAHVDVKSTWQTGTITDHQTGSTTDTIKSTQQKYEQYRKDTSTTAVETEPTGELSTAVTLHNPGNITYTVNDLAVTALRSDPDRPGSVETLATLTPDVTAPITLAPGDTKGPYKVTSSSVSSDTLIELLANPSGIVYSIPSPSLVNATTKVDYAVVGQSVEAQTAGITVDDGTDNPRTYLVATNVARNPDGSNAGIAAKDALTSILHQRYGTCRQTDGRQVLCSVGSVSTTDEYHFWSLLTDDDTPLGGDFDDLQLTAGSVLRMVYVVDSDEDGLFDPVENLYGTDVTQADTDGDSLTDAQETQTGWTVPAIGSPGQYGYQAAHQVYSSPLATDVDGDSSPDACAGGATTCGLSGYAPESTRKTDPNLPDTNDDGVLDGQQADADVLTHCPGCYRSPDFVLSFGKGAGTGDGQFGGGPGPLGVNPSTGEVFVADPTNYRIEKFRADGSWERSFGGRGNLPGLFGTITGVAVDRQGNVYVTCSYDTGSTTPPAGAQGQLQKFTSTGTLVKSVSSNALGVAVDSVGSVFTFDRLALVNEQDMVVNKYSSQLSLLSTYSSAQTNPFYQALPRQGLTVAGLAVDPDGRIFTAASITAGTNGKYTGMIERITPRQAGGGGDVVVPQGLYEGAASDRAGHLYVTNTDIDLVLKLDPDTLQTLVQIGGHGTGQAQFDQMVGVATDDDCSVYVSDLENKRVQKFSYQTGCS